MSDRGRYRLPLDDGNDRRGVPPDVPGLAGPSPSVLNRRAAAEQARRRRLLLADAGIAAAIVLICIIAGIGIGLLGVIAILVLAGCALSLLPRRWAGRRRRRRRASRAR